MLSLIVSITLSLASATMLSPNQCGEMLRGIERQPVRPVYEVHRVLRSHFTRASRVLIVGETRHAEGDRLIYFRVLDEANAGTITPDQIKVARLPADYQLSDGGLRFESALRLTIEDRSFVLKASEAELGPEWERTLSALLYVLSWQPEGVDLR